jgi:hypothetical protein
MASSEFPHCAVGEHLLSSTARVAIYLLERAMACYGHDLMLARACSAKREAAAFLSP